VQIETRFDFGTITLDPGKNKTVTLRLKADDSVNAESHIIDVEARTSTGAVAPASATVLFTIPAFHEVSVLSDQGQTEISFPDAVVGRTYQTSIQLDNLGNALDTYTMLVTSDNMDLPSWFTFEEDEVEIEAGKSTVMLVTVMIPTTGLAGSFDFDIVAKSLSANESGSLAGSIVVTPDRVVLVNAETTQASVDPSGGPGDGAVFTITVMNNGNVAETVTLEVNVPAGWQAPVIDPETVSMAPFSTMTMTVTFSPSSVPDTAPTTNAITVKARYGPFSSPMLNLVVDVLKPIITVDKVTIADLNPKEGDLVDITITLENDGQVDATGLDVTLLVDGAPVASLKGQSVPSGGTKDIAMQWGVEAAPGDIVSMQVRVPQTDLTYQVLETVEIASDEQTFLEQLEDYGLIPLVGIGLVIGLVIGLLIAVAIARRFKKRLEATRAAGVAEGLSIADMETDEEGEDEVDEDEEGAEEYAEEDPGEEGAEESEEGEEDEDSDIEPVTVQCPKCDTLNKVTTAQRPYEFRCEECNALLRLSR
jgi:hypothetical protein